MKFILAVVSLTDLIQRNDVTTSLGYDLTSPNYMEYLEKAASWIVNYVLSPMGCFFLDSINITIVFIAVCTLSCSPSNVCKYKAMTLNFTLDKQSYREELTYFLILCICKIRNALLEKKINQQAPRCVWKSQFKWNLNCRQ